MEPSRLRASSRKQLSKLLHDSPSLLTLPGAAVLLGLTSGAVARRLAAWSSAGWLARVRRGACVLVPIESASRDIALDNPCSVATAIFAPCHIGGWSEAERWRLTGQIVRLIGVMTATRPRNRKLCCAKRASNVTPFRQPV